MVNDSFENGVGFLPESRPGSEVVSSTLSPFIIESFDKIDFLDEYGSAFGRSAVFRWPFRVSE